MTLARKHTRPINVDNVSYRWMFKEADYGACFELLLIVEADEYPNGQQLVARIAANERREHDAVTPGVVAALIREAKASGWRPDRLSSCPPCDELLVRLVRSRVAT